MVVAAAIGAAGATTGAAGVVTVFTVATTTGFGALNMPRAIAVASSTTFVTFNPFAV